MKLRLTYYLLFGFLLFLVPQKSSAQYDRLDFGIRVGGANYLGEMGGEFSPRKDFIIDLKIPQTSFALGVYGRYGLSKRWNISLAYMVGRIRGADSLTVYFYRNRRNLSFRNTIKDLTVAFEYELVEEYNIWRNYQNRFDFRMYGFIGLGYFWHNPQAYYEGTLNGKNYSGWHDLQPLLTEGVQYPLNGAAILSGFGFNFTANRIIRFGLRVGHRSTFTDYLDDVSTEYPDPATWAQSSDPALSAALSNRAKAEFDQDSFSPGKIRGNPNRNDSYFFLTAEVGVVKNIRPKRRWPRIIKF